MLLQDKVTLASMVSSRRAELALSLRVAAGRCGLSHSYLASIESGENVNPTVEKLHGLARGLGLPYAQLDRLARGLPVDDAAIDQETDELLSAWERLPAERRSMVLKVIEAMTDQQ